MKKPATNNNGFTLLGLMIALAISSMVMAGVYAIYFAQTNAKKNQDMMMDMMQNLRAGLYYMERDIRVAGYDPDGDAGAGITTANLSDIQFSLDSTNDGDITDTGEQIRYMLSNDANGDGIADAAGGTLQYQNTGGGGLQTLVNNIQALQFYYFNAAGARLDDDGNGNVTTNIGNIATVQIAMVARTQGIKSNLNNTTTYSVTLISGANNTVYQAPGDNVGRALLTTSVRCRNL